jgi:hypothetical protein
MGPIPPPDELLLVVADLARPETSLVQIEPDGRIRHHPRCTGRHELHDDRLARLVLPDAAFLLSAALYGPPQHPRVRVIDPEISARTYRGHPHLYHPDVICPLFPPEKTWSWHTHNLVDYLGHVAVWLLKSLIWIATRDTNGKGLWIGPDVPHDAETLLRLTAPEDPCHCGSGGKYKKCHRSQDIIRFMAERGGEIHRGSCLVGRGGNRCRVRVSRRQHGSANFEETDRPARGG